ncbi:MAG: peptide/nickel transport system ATP-binding protein ddpF [Solirubrobacteraceae bacterium]|nr:peptide/nickel transport system ATP-binding protein ddpF [Solirubrobacteraceae bacterium]
MERGEAQDEKPAEAGPLPLSIRDLEVRLHQRDQVVHALRGVDFDVARGEIVALVGESGSGKSTLSLAVQGLLSAAARPEVTGSVLVDGTEVVGAPGSTLRRVRRERVRSIFQDPMTSLNPTMRVGHQLAEAARDDRPPEAWLERVGIAQPARRVNAFPHELSGGERQRVMIAMAMSGKPVLVLADEPTTALDVTVQAQILELIRELRRDSDTAFVFVTHDLAVATTVADRIAVIYGGRIVESGSVEQVVANPAHPYSAALLEARFGLDADKGHQLPTLRGDPASATMIEDACSFAPRCLLARDDCRATRPPLAPVRQHDGRAACLHSDEVTPELWQRTASPWSRAPTEPPEPIVVIENLRQTFMLRGRDKSGKVVALDGVNLTMRKGEAVAIVGESGSGKSSLLKVIAGLATADSGTCRHESSVRPQMVFQDAAASLTPWMKIGDLARERLKPLGLTAAEQEQRIATALERVGLSPSLASRLPAQLSGGQQQRAAIARAIIVPPDLLLCDEPVSGMDVSLAAAILNLLGELRRELGMALLFVTHDLSAARFIADRMLVMQRGRLVEDGTSEQIVSAPTNDYTRELLASMPGAGVV